MSIKFQKFQNFQEFEKHKKIIFTSNYSQKFNNNSNLYSWPSTTPIFTCHAFFALKIKTTIFMAKRFLHYFWDFTELIITEIIYLLTWLINIVFGVKKLPFFSECFLDLQD